MTVRIECVLADGRVAVGTGFFYSIDETGSQRKVVIVTNKHVVSDAKVARFCLTRKGASGEPVNGVFDTIELTEFEKDWVPHPDPDVDLCVINISHVLDDLIAHNREPFFAIMDSALIPRADEIESLFGAEDVHMIGYPAGLWDEKNNLPIIRKGTVATNYGYDFQGKKEFRVDIACFTGSSGSPIICIKTIINGTEFVTRPLLLGVVSHVHVQNAEGKIVKKPVPTVQGVVAITEIPIGIAVVIKSELLRDFEGFLK